MYVGRVDQPAATPGERLIESESEALYVPLESDSSGLLLTVVAAGVQIQRFDASRRTLIGHPRLIDLAVGVSTPHERAMLAASRGVLASAPTPITRSNRVASVARDGSGGRVWPEFDPHNWPRLSPDGTRLVFQRVDGRRGSAALWVKDLVRGTETRVTSPPNHALLPAWSPGGDRLALLWGRPGNATLAIGAADGTGTITARACPFPRCDVSDWSPDGRSLIVTAYTPRGTDVWSVPADESTPDQPRPLFAESYNERDARVSPDGQWMAYVADETGRDEVSVRRVSGRDRTVISSGGGYQPVWRRDGAELLYVDSNGRLRGVPIKRSAGSGGLVPGQPALLSTPAIGTSHWSTQYDVSPDGSRVYYVDRTQLRPRALKSFWVGPASYAEQRPFFVGPAWSERVDLISTPVVLPDPSRSRARRGAGQTEVALPADKAELAAGPEWPISENPNNFASRRNLDADWDLLRPPEREGGIAQSRARGATDSPSTSGRNHGAFGDLRKHSVLFHFGLAAGLQSRGKRCGHREFQRWQRFHWVLK